MGKTFLRTLAAVAVVQFVITRTMAGRTIEEGRAEQMWMMYPLNVLVNAAAWTLVLAALSRGRRRLVRAS
jgi:hypothetical protein